MKIVSWNCNGRFRDKVDEIGQLDAEIYIIQESENPLKYPQQFQKILSNHIWYGLNDNKGLLVFSNKTITLKNNDWENYGLRHFLSVKINNSFDLIAVWASRPYIEEYFVFQQIS